MTRPPRCSSPLTTVQDRRWYQHDEIKSEYMAKRVRFRLLDAEFYSIQFIKCQTDRIGALTSLRVRFAFGAPLEFSELSSEALRLPEASEGAMWSSRLLVRVDVMFIDKGGGCGCQCCVCRAR